jgi:hypothetical protein
MKLYVNGDSHTAAAEAVNSCAFAEDDGELRYLGRLPHPANLAVSWGKCLSQLIRASFYCDAESAASNQRIIRTTRDWINSHRDSLNQTLIVIQWSTWERQEWLIENEWLQINASGVDVVPESHQLKYKEFISTVDWNTVTEQAHTDIWNFHQELDQAGVRHVFFNGNTHFESIPKKQRHNWGTNYINPYRTDMTYSQWLKNNGFDTVAPNSYHFGKEAHAAWSRYVLQYIIDNRLI